MTAEDKPKEDVIKKVAENNVKFVRLWFTDILGFLKSFAVTVNELEDALESGKGFDGSSIQGFARIDESDMIAMPDPSTFQILPWRPQGENKVARMFCDVLLPEGPAYECDPRWVLRRNLKKAADMGYIYYVGPELEYFYFKSAKGVPERSIIEGFYGVDLAKSKVVITEYMLPIDDITYKGDPKAKFEVAPGKSVWIGFMIDDNDVPGADYQNFCFWPATYSTFAEKEVSAYCTFE